MGEKIPPTIVNPYKRKLPRSIADLVPTGWSTGISESGWMNSEVFYGYIANAFIPFIKRTNTKLPVVLFVDGYKSHITLQVSELCSENNIVLIAFYPNCTHFLQPADVSVFSPMKKNWKQIARQWQYENFPNTITRQTFASILKTALDKVTPETIINGFRTCGIFPFNPDEINFQKLIKSRNTENVFLKKEAPDQTKEMPKQNSSLDICAALSAIEKYIDEDKLIMFEEVFASRNEWFEQHPEDVHAQELYQVWRALKRDALEELRTLENKEDNDNPIVTDVTEELITQEISLKIPDNDNPILINVPPNVDGALMDDVPLDDNITFMNLDSFN